MNQKVPALQSFAFEWKSSDFIWNTSFIENLTLSDRKKYIDYLFPDFDFKQYIENPFSYDAQIPYLSIIVKLIVNSKYLELLQEEEEKRRFQTPLSTKTVVESDESIPPKKIEGKSNHFKCKLNKDAIRLLTDCVNDAHIFTTEITTKILKEPDNPDKLHLNLHGMNILDWFRQKYQEVQEQFGINRKQESGKSKGIKM